MVKGHATGYQILVYLAYGFYFLLGASWFVISYFNTQRFNPSAFLVMAVFGVQSYYKHLLSNLVLGVITLLFSIYMFLHSLNSAVLASRMGSLMLFDKLMVAMTVASLAFSGILIFSFLKLNFKD